MMPSVLAADVSRTFGKRQALDGVSVSWGPGVHGLLGPNGAGKTTLLRILATLDSPSGGELRLFGSPARRADVRGRVGYLPQRIGIPYALTPRDLVTYTAHLRGLGPGIAELVDSALELAGAGDFADRRLRRLSGGERQRAGIAAAVVGAPDLILLDEPTAGLDPHQRVALRSVLRRISGSSTVVMSTHLVEDVALGCESVTVLRAGRVAFDGRPDELAAAARGGPPDPSVSPLERGYLSVMDGPGAGDDR